MNDTLNLAVTLDERFGAGALAAAQRDAGACGAELVRADGGDDRLEAWIDWQFAPSWWSSEVRAGSVWYAQRDGEILGFAAFGARGLQFPWLRAWRETDAAVFGPFGVIEAERGSGIGAALLMAALASLRASGAPRAVIPAVADGPLAAMYVERTGATIAERYRHDVRAPRATILASGNGTNAQAVFDAIAAGTLQLDVAALVANDAVAPALDRARRAGVTPVTAQWDRGAESRAAYDARLSDVVASTQPELVLLLGWMHLLAPAFLERLPETLNVHPAFLPFDPSADEVTLPDGTRQAAYRGARAIQAALAAGAGWIGASVHRVTAATDRGAIVVRTPLRLAGETTVAEVVARLRPVEHAAVLSAIRRWTFEAAGA